MHLAHVRPAATSPAARRAAGRHGRWQQPERGYTLLMMALLLIPMMVFSDLAVDVGFWYTRAAEVQRAVDAAALAGVVWMPGDPDRAASEARLAASRNGFAHDPSGTGIVVDVQPVPGRPQELDVTITDPHVGTFFGAVILDEITITRTARARYVLPVPLGSPHNTFGNQNLNPTASDPKLWAAINAPYARHESGDPYAVRCAGDPSGVRSCSGGANDDYRAEGYRYIIDVPTSAVGQTLTVEVFDAPFARRSGTTTETGDGWDWSCCTGNTSTSTYTNRMALNYELFEADATPLDITDNPTMNGRCSSGPGRLVYGNNHGTPNSRTNVNSGNTHSDRNAWRTVCRMTVSTAGQYVLQVQSSAIAGQVDQGSGTNQYSLRASLSGGTQPRLYAYGDMSILTNYAVSGSNTRANMYLAEVVQRHAGKTLRIELFDAGDGSNGQFDLSILAPDGTVPQCRYNEPDETDLGSLQTCTIRTRNDGTSTSNNLYNDQWLTIEIPISSSYTCNASGATPYNPGPGVTTACWWRLSYLFGGTNPTPTDRTTWRADVLGDPVQLIR